MTRQIHMATSAKLGEALANLAASQADLTRVEGELAEARAELHLLRHSEDADLAITRAELASARTELERLRRELGQAP
ncbi:hypothetical protein [Paractinoplanes maris]|uniref:hypothetical protein n=1 Tax=Paractinoplanes maris TaxID=1734446 RepID=UPI002022996B|nr:hypothetical protein [Actinoplanes maris]